MKCLEIGMETILEGINHIVKIACHKKQKNDLQTFQRSYVSALETIKYAYVRRPGSILVVWARRTKSIGFLMEEAPF